MGISTTALEPAATCELNMVKSSRLKINIQHSSLLPDQLTSKTTRWQLNSLFCKSMLQQKYSSQTKERKEADNVSHGGQYNRTR